MPRMTTRSRAPCSGYGRSLRSCRGGVRSRAKNLKCSASGRGLRTCRLRYTRRKGSSSGR